MITKTIQIYLYVKVYAYISKDNANIYSYIYGGADVFSHHIPQPGQVMKGYDETNM